MKQKRNGGRRLLALLLAVCLLGGLTANVFAFDNVVASGTCGAEGDGSNLRWSMTASGVLTITGSGAMADYEESGEGPWREVHYQEQYYYVKELKLDDRITHIGSYAFKDCTHPDGTLVLPVSCVSIGKYAFDGLTFSGTLQLPAGLQYIGGYAFCYCQNLTGDLVIPEGCVTVGDSAFDYAYSETAGTLTLPSTLLTIGEYAFHDCKFSGELKLPSGVTSIGKGAFGGTTRYTGTLTIPGSCTSIGAEAFSGDFDTLILEPGVRSIGYGAFSGCEKLTGSLILPDGLAEIGDYAFWNCTALSGTLQIPGSVKTIGDRAFAYCGMTKLVLGDGIESIGEFVFYDCESLTGNVRIPDSVTTLGRDAFAHTASLTSVTLSRGLKTIGESAFYNSGLTGTLIIPQGVEGIGAKAFQQCKKLTKLKLPASLSVLGNEAFSGCSGLTGTLRLPDDLTDIPVSAFESCSGLTGLKLPAKLKHVENDAFSGCTGLTGEVIIGEQIGYISRCAFDYCDNVTAFCFRGDAPSPTSSGVIYGANDIDHSFPREATVRYIEGKKNWTGTRYNNSTNTTWRGYKLETWDGHEIKLIDEDQNPDISDTSIYDDETIRQIDFRIYVPGAKWDSTVNGFEVTIDGNTYRNIKDCDYGYEEIRAEKRKDDTGKIVISREGYYTYEMPAQWANIVEYVLMTPKTVTAPFAQTLYSRRGELLVSANWIDVYQDTPGSDPQDPVSLYAKINWNGHGAGKVWLQQGETKIELKNNEWTSCDTLGQLEPNKTVYLCAEAADGATTRARTRILIHEAEPVNLDIDLGRFDLSTETLSNHTKKNELDIFGYMTKNKMNLEVDLSKAFEDSIIKITYGRDGLFKAVVGVKIDEGSTTEAAYGRLKEAFAKLGNANNKEQNKRIAKELESLQKEGNIFDVKPHSKVGLDGNLQFVGIFTGNVFDDKFAFTDIKFALIGKGTLSYTNNMIVLGWMPAYFKVALEAKVQAVLNIIYNAQTPSLKVGKTPVDISVKPSIEVGPGWEGYASCAVKGAATLTVHCCLPLNRDEITATWTSSLSLVGSLANTSGEWTIYETDGEYLFWDKNGYTWKKYEPETDSNTLAFRPDTNMQVMSFALAKQADGTIAQNVSGYSAPDMVQLADGRLLAVWTADVPDRKLSDRGGIYYSVRSQTGTWSSPLLVWNDGTSDCAPVLQTLGSDVWVVWQNNKTAKNTDDLNTISFDALAENCDIAAARFDLTGSAFTDAKNIGTSGYSYAPQLSLQNSAVTAAWKQAVVSENTTTETVWTSSYKNGAWSAPAQASGSAYPEKNALPSTWEEGMTEPAASARQCFSTDSYDAVVYTAADENGVNQVYALWNDGYGWGEPFALTAVQSSGGIGGFRAVIDGDEQIHILANVLTLDADGKYQSADLTLFEKKLGADLTVSEADYVRRTLIPGRTVTLTAEVTNNGTKTVEGVHISALNGETCLSEADFGITLLPGQTKTAYLNYDLPESSTLTGVTLRVVPQDDTDADESDNTAQCAFQLVDLSVENVTSIVYNGGTLLQAQIVNRGQRASAAGSVVFRLGSPEGEELGTVALAAIEAGGLEQAELTLKRVLDERTMIYVETPVQLDENLYGNNSNYGVVMGVPAQAQTSSVSESYADGTLTLDVSLEHISTAVRAIAAAYDTDGRLLQTAAQTGTDGSLALNLRTGAKPASWKLFLLDAATNQPICDCMEG